MCEVVGLYMLQKLGVLEGFECLLYRDDGLGVTQMDSKQQDALGRKIRKMFEEEGLGITLEINLPSVDFLDVTLDMKTGFYKPFRKLGDFPSHISSSSNHPPQILKNLPAGIERRLSNNSANSEIFHNALPPYQAELLRCGFEKKLEYCPSSVQTGGGRRRSRRVTWYNPPYCMNVASNVAKDFLALIDKHFKPDNRLRA